MSTEHMPNPLTNPAAQTTDAGVKAQSVPAAQPSDSAPQATQSPLSLGADLARIFEEQVDIISQRLVYNTQMLMGVSALGSDPVSARDTTLVVANALRNDNPDAIEHALVNLGDAQIAQINDKTSPLKLNSQLAGLLEGILLNTVSQAYNADPTRLREARIMLDNLFLPANELMQSQPRAMVEFQAPGPGPNARQ
ncbi:MAG: hypothetical protein IVW55_01670 [Chloroflexi bacterium]|nr:hypothetical protein [Chloroflexota bacterium]